MQRSQYPVSGPEHLDLRPLDQGLWRLRLPMRFNPGHINSYLLRDDAGWTVVDCGNNTRETHQAWKAFMASDHYGPGIVRILLTHAHPDHAGSAGWLAETTGSPLFLAAEEEDAFNRLWRGSAEQPDALKAFYADWGATTTQQNGIVTFMQGFQFGCPPLPEHVNHLEPGELLCAGGREWQLIAGRGHTPCNLLFHDRTSGWVITGDQVLPRIQPNVSLWFGSVADPVGDFLRSLEGLEALSVSQACPAHGDVFDDFAERCRQQRRQLLRRLDRLASALVDTPGDIDSLCDSVLGKASEGPLFMLVAGQLYALLAHMEANGRVFRQGTGEQLRFVLADQ